MLNMTNSWMTYTITITLKEYKIKHFFYNDKRKTGSVCATSNYNVPSIYLYL